MLFFETNDATKIFYEEKGSGPPLVLLHGWSGSSAYFVNNFDNLAHTFRVIRYDQRGHGASQNTAHGRRVSRLAMDLNNLLDHLGLECAAVLGCSMGSAVIWAYVELFGCSRLKAAIFVDQSPYQLYAPDGSWRLGSNGLFSAAALAHLCAMLRTNARDCHNATVDACLTRQATQSERDLFVAESLRADGTFLGDLMADHNANDWRPALPLVTCPALVVAGKKGKIFPWEGVAFAANHMPKARLEVFDEGSHWVYFEEAERFNTLVTEFLEGGQADSKKSERKA